jgi:hypothetical protein
MKLHSAPTASSVASGLPVVSSLTLRRLQRALRERVRYRYVKPLVVQEGDAFRIQSPNCSRKVDPRGGVIDIALLVPHKGSRWCLCARNHAEGAWVPQLQNAALDDALDALCADPDRQYWP